jgi:hypothetical protein
MRGPFFRDVQRAIWHYQPAETGANLKVSKGADMNTQTQTQRIARLRQGLMRPITLYPNRIERGHKTYPLTGVHAEVTAAGGMTGTRFITITGPGFAWTQRTDTLFESMCRRFAAKVNAAAAAAAAGQTV